VCRWGEFLAVWPWAANCSSNQLSTSLPSLPYVSQPSHHLLQLSHLPQEVLSQAHLLQAGLLPVPAPGERSRHFLQSEACTAACPFSSSARVEASATAEVGGAGPPAGAAAFVHR